MVSNLSIRVSQALKNFALHTAGTRILIAGRGSRLHLKSSPNVRVLGHLDDMRDFYNACDVVIGTGRVVAESLACKTPTLMIGTGGYHGLITEHNLQRTISHNFADHAATHRTWTKSQLHHRLTQVRSERIGVRKNTRRVNSLIRDRLSTARLVQRVLIVYKSIVSKHPRT